MSKPLIRCYTGDELLKVSDNVYSPLIEGIINRGDLVMLNGRYKSFKSLIAMQMACSLTSGTPFLGAFEAVKPCVVWHFSTEGKDDETKDRYIRMGKKVPFDKHKLFLFCSSQLKINTETGKINIEALVNNYKDNPPSLIIIDSVYSGFYGKLIDEQCVNDFITQLRYLSEAFDGCAILLCHHLKKSTKDEKGNVRKVDDDEGYGSVFFNGQADHIFRIEAMKKGGKLDRMIVCETQRSGKIVEEICIHLNEPDPLYISLIGTHDAERDRVLAFLRKTKKDLSINEILDGCNLTKSLGYIIIKELVNEKLVTRSSGYKGRVSLSNLPKPEMEATEISISMR